MNARLLASKAALALILSCASAATWAQSGPLRIVTSSGAGGFDVYMRLLAPKLGEALGRPVVIDNRPGGNGNIAMAEVARAVPDGNTLLYTATGTLTINPSLYKQMPVDPRDFETVSLVVTVPMIWVTHPRSGIKSLADVVSQAKAKPGRLNFALAANGSINHLIFEGLKQSQKVDIVAVPYKSTPFAEQDVVAGNVDMMVDSMGSAMALIRAGSMVPLAVTTRTRSSVLPEVPTVTELGLDDRDYVGWYGLLAPKGTPRPMINKINAEIIRILDSAEMKARIRSMGAEPNLGSPEQFRKFIADETEKWGGIARTAKIVVE